MGTKKEKARFVIQNESDGTLIEFNANGSTVAAIVAAFGWLTPTRRQTAIARIAKVQEELMVKEALRAAEELGKPMSPAPSEAG